MQNSNASSKKNKHKRNYHIGYIPNFRSILYASLIVMPIVKIDIKETKLKYLEYNENKYSMRSCLKYAPECMIHMLKFTTTHA